MRERSVRVETYSGFKADQRPLRLHLGDRALEPIAILLRIPQSIDVIEPQSVQLTIADQSEHEGMDGFEGRQVFDA